MKILLFLFVATLLFSENLFKSDEDGAFDISHYLGTRYGFLPVPTIITEPAVGYGGGVNLMFLHNTFNSIKQTKTPPSISGVFVGATENGTKGVAAYHLGFWEKDTIRTTTFVGYSDINMNFYQIDMNLKGYFGYQELMFRLKDSNFFLGANYLYSDIDSQREDAPSSQLSSLFKHTFKMGAAAAFVQYDSRDTIFTPSNGLFAKVILRRFDEHLGGDENFWRYGAKFFYFLPLSKELTLGLRAEGEGVTASKDDSVPYFANPYIIMRGIPAMRYQGEKVLLGEMQLRYEFIPRWNFVAFGGIGKAFQRDSILETPHFDVDSIEKSSVVPAGGIGFRYELARKFGLWGGLDFATSKEEDISLYITVGSAWGAY